MVNRLRAKHGGKLKRARLTCLKGLPAFLLTYALIASLDRYFVGCSTERAILPGALPLQHDAHALGTLSLEAFGSNCWSLSQGEICHSVKGLSGDKVQCCGGDVFGCNSRFGSCACARPRCEGASPVTQGAAQGAMDAFGWVTYKIFPANKACWPHKHSMHEPPFDNVCLYCASERRDVPFPPYQDMQRTRADLRKLWKRGAQGVDSWGPKVEGREHYEMFV